MEAVVLIGIQGSGKTTFCKQRFFDSHLRISLDMLRTRHREKLLVSACIQAKQRFVVDNTNVKRGDRARYIQRAAANRFSLIGYFFPPDADRAMLWNERRNDKPAIPVKGLLGTLKRLERPKLTEGFNELYQVNVDSQGHFFVTSWNV